MMKGLFRGCLIGLGIIILFSIVSAMFGGGKGKTASSTPAAVAAVPTQAPETTTVSVPTDVPEPTVAPTVAPAETSAPLTETSAPAAAVRPGVDPVDGQCEGEYAIKGNVTENKIYHVPGSTSYKRTKAEVCFATAADAVAAGFRAPER